MNGNFRVGNLFGIPFYINISWFIVLVLVTLNFGGGLSSQFPGLGINALILGLVAGLLLFASVLLHELGHSYAAIRQGIGVNSITLFLFGGLANLDEEAKTPGGAFWIAVAGPLVSLALFIALFLLTGSGVLSGPPAAIAGLLAYINLILATFNMIPGLPLDGGNVLKSIVWKLTGNRFTGTIWASRVGQFIGWTAIILGALSILGISNVGSFWTLIIGWFLLQNAGRSAQSATIQSALSGLTAADAVVKDSPIISAETTLRDLANSAIRSGNQWKRFLVQDETGQLLGEVHLDVLRAVPTNDWPHNQVRDFIKSVPAENQVQSDLSLLDVAAKLEQQGLQALAVIQTNGTLVGLLEKSAIIKLLQSSQQDAKIQSA
ncbi:site-2 protease family protein [Picosynechococcus sp. PCC 11901]|uniref:site-2 protease family protein n=1 Tax=Picosynechococcus sp. PCC 11901 TaxID=2579791 RepID=UPI0010FC20ED|nr:site-2 protease family protein [Picosynechococcus sp. PCC 11901]QCS50212.1 site-2 protease family protein [Picosynechococcus sp. PCC 11901]